MFHYCDLIWGEKKNTSLISQDVKERSCNGETAFRVTAADFYGTFIPLNFLENRIFVEMLVHNLPRWKTFLVRDILNTKKHNQLLLHFGTQYSCVL